MERIKEALEKARAQREAAAGLAGQAAMNGSASGSRLGKDRILQRDPFRRYSPAEQAELLESGRVLNIAMGETLQFAGDKDVHVHYLLAGAVVLESEDQQLTTVTADQSAALLPLDRPGVKLHTILAATDVEVLRVPGSALPDMNFDDPNPIPKAAYAETYSGQQLAELVDQINTANDFVQNATPGTVGAAGDMTLEREDIGVSLSQLSESAQKMLTEIDAAPEDPNFELGESNYMPQCDDELGQFTRELEIKFRRYVDKVKLRERERYEAQLHRHAERLKKMAEEQLRRALARQREQAQKLVHEKEIRLREHYKNLRLFANKVARQKAAIYVARRQISEKLHLVEKIHSELAQLGTKLNDQLDELEGEMPSVNPAENAGPGR
ncbi:MAG: hypothetical protein O3C28_09375 [Proteobacteria bacterium]|nr:hypothetical protein [Pseudomonadota bacterium]